MGTYREGDTQRFVALTPDGAGAWNTTDEHGDPMWTLAKRFGHADVASAIEVSSASNSIHTPAAGNAIRLKWIYVASPEDSVDTVVLVTLTGTQYHFPLPAPGVFLRTSIREGDADDSLVVALSPATTAYVNYELEEFTP
jgi:hypothetical protein